MPWADLGPDMHSLTPVLARLSTHHFVLTIFVSFGFGGGVLRGELNKVSVAQASLEFIKQPRMTSKSYLAPSLTLLSAGVTGMYHYA